jgi:hypothetical protein
VAGGHLERALHDELAQQPEAEVLVRLALADLYLERGELERASVHAQRARELAETTRGVGKQDRRRVEELLTRLGLGPAPAE